MPGTLRWNACLLLCGSLAAGAAAAQDADADIAPPKPQAPAAMAMPGVERLPDDPTREEVSAYLAQIAEVTRTQPHDPRRDDPQAALLALLADAHLDELFQAHESYPELRYYLDPIIHREIARRGGPDATRLSALKLRPGANDDEAWSYVMDIARATAGQRRVSANDPQVAMLAALADEHLPVLIDALDLDDLRFYAQLAIRGAVTQEHRETIVSALVDQPRLIGIVRQAGWGEAARDQLILGLESGVTHMPRTWVQVTAELRDPETYDALCLQLLRSRCSRTYYSLVRDLPGIDLTPAVHAAWERVFFQPTDPREMREVSEIAVVYGHTGALEHLVHLLPTEGAIGMNDDEDLRAVVLKHLPVTGTNDEVRAWFDAHRDRLRFSPHDQRYYAAGGLR